MRQEIGNQTMGHLRMWGLIYTPRRGRVPVDPEVKIRVKVPSRPPSGCSSGGSRCTEAPAVISIGWVAADEVCASEKVCAAEKACTASTRNDTATASSTPGDEVCAGDGRRGKPAIITVKVTVTVTVTATVKTKADRRMGL